MARKAKPYIHQGWYKTDAVERNHKLCPIEDGPDKAQELLDAWLKQAQERKREAAAQGLVQTDTPYTFEELAAECLKLVRSTKKDKTFKDYHYSLQFPVRLFGNVAAAKVTLSHATEMIAGLKKSGVKNSTVNHHIRAVKKVLNYGMQADIIARNPWKGLELLPEGGRQRIMTDEEFQKLLKACDGCIAWRGRVSREENQQLMRDILHILRFTAMRPCELRLLRWEYIRLEEGEDTGLIVIPKEELKTGTTARHPEDRLIPILPEGRAILEARRRTHGHNEYVFPNLRGEKWNDAVFSKRFKMLRDRAGLNAPDHRGERLVWYSLRHTRLTEAGVKEGWAYATLQRFAGHARGSKITSRYQHPDKDDLLRAATEGAKKRAGQQPA
jgi:integrase